METANVRFRVLVPRDGLLQGGLVAHNPDGMVIYLHPVYERFVAFRNEMGPKAMFSRISLPKRSMPCASNACDFWAELDLPALPCPIPVDLEG